MQISAIVAMTPDRIIGNKNKLPRNYPEDLKYFRKMTTGGIVIMGRKTYESIGRPLPHRRNIILSRNAFVDETYPKLEVYPNIETLLQELDRTTSPEQKIWVIGGAGIYSAFLERNLIDTLYITEIKKSYEGNVYFPMFKDDFVETQREEGKELDFVIYQKKE